MNKTAEIVLSVSIAVSLVIISLSIAHHINQAQSVELQTPWYMIRSQYPLKS